MKFTLLVLSSLLSYPGTYLAVEVTMPSAEVLYGQLDDYTFRPSSEFKNIVVKLANQNVKTDDVITCVENGLQEYYENLKDEGCSEKFVKSMQWAMENGRKNLFYEALLQRPSEILNELEQAKVYTPKTTLATMCNTGDLTKRLEKNNFRDFIEITGIVKKLADKTIEARCAGLIVQKAIDQYFDNLTKKGYPEELTNSFRLVMNKKKILLLETLFEKQPVILDDLYHLGMYERALVKMPTVKVLKKCLKDNNFRDFNENTDIVKKLADQTIEISHVGLHAVLEKINKACIEYCDNLMKKDYSENAVMAENVIMAEQHLMFMRKNQLLETLFESVSDTKSPSVILLNLYRLKLYKPKAELVKTYKANNNKRDFQCFVESLKNKKIKSENYVEGGWENCTKADWNVEDLMSSDLKMDELFKKELSPDSCLDVPSASEGEFQFLDFN